MPPLMFSVTELAGFFACPLRWSLRTERTTQTVYTVRGTAVHRSREHVAKGEIKTGRMPPLADALDVAASYVQDAFAAGVEVRGVDTTVSARARVTDTVVRLAQIDYDTTLRYVEPVHSELRVSSRRTGWPMTVTGHIDLVTNVPLVGHRLHDLKTSVRDTGRSQADRSLQLSLYAMLYADMIGVPKLPVVVDMLLDQKRPSARTYWSKRDQIDFHLAEGRIRDVARMVKAGLFPPCAVEAWHCCEEHCSEWFRCPRVRSNGRALR